MGAQYRTINRGGHSIYEEVHKAGYDPYVRTISWYLGVEIDFPFHFLERNTSDSIISVLMIGSTHLEVSLAITCVYCSI